GLAIGAWYTPGSGFDSSVTVWEFLAFDRVLTVDERRLVHRYLASKYGLLRGPRVVGGIDPLPSGGPRPPGAGDYLSALEAYVTPHSLITNNTGVVGRQTGTALGAQVTEVDALASGVDGVDVYVYLGGTNDLVNEGEGAAETALENARD